MYKLRKNGFTLIEILIILIVISILVTLIMPLITTMPEKARLAESKIVIGSIRNELLVICLEKNAFPENPIDTTSQSLEDVIGEFLAQEGSLFNYTYLKNTDSQCTIYAERNTNNWPGNSADNHWLVKLVIYGDGHADDLQYLSRNSDLPSPDGPTANDW